MDPAELLSAKEKLSLKSKRFLTEFSFDNPLDIDEIKEGIHEAKNLIDSFDGMKVDFERKLGNNFEVHFPEFEKSVEPLIDWVSKGRSEIRDKKAKEQVEWVRIQSEEEEFKQEKENEFRLQVEQEQKDRLEVEKLRLEEKEGRRKKSLN